MKEMLRNPPSLIRMGNGSAKYESRPLSGAARRPSRRILPMLLVAFVLCYLAYTHLTSSTAIQLRTSKETTSSTFSKQDGTLAKSAPPAEVELEPRPHKLELVSPMYNVKVLRSILQHSNTSWQDKPGEAHGYFVQSLVWFQNVCIGLCCQSRKVKVLNSPTAHRLTVYVPTFLQISFLQCASSPIRHHCRQTSVQQEPTVQLSLRRPVSCTRTKRIQMIAR